MTSLSAMGEAYMKHGDKGLAIQNYEKSLELNPENSNAASMLKRLNQGREQKRQITSPQFKVPSRPA
jgi:cytochrome c-type biogenesis protein CcmH/NrfG